MKAPVRLTLGLPMLALACVTAAPAIAYDFPLSPEAIREAYALGMGSGRGDASFLSQYRRKIPALRAGPYVSMVTLETPFVQVAERAAIAANYNAQAAEREFSKKTLRFRILLDVCYLPTQPEPAKIRILQNGKELIPRSDDRSAFYPFQDEYNYQPSVGEHIQMQFEPSKIDSSLLTVEIDTPSGQHGETTFDLADLK